MTLKGVTLAEKLRLAREAGVSLPHYTNTDNPVDFPQSKTEESINTLIKNRNYMKYELIGKLADKAIKDMPGAWNIPDEFCKKFAQLIVEDCRTVVTEVYRKTSLELCGPLLTADEEIAKHFYGVGE